MAFNLFKKKAPKAEEPERVPAPAAADVPTTETSPKATPAAAPAAPTGPSVLRRMHVSEKSALGHAMGQYTFVVDSDATKPKIAKAVEARYSVKVRSVKIVNLPSKTKRVGKYFGSRSGVTKAIVVLADGQSIPTA